MAAYLHTWIQANTKELIRDRTVKSNLGDLGNAIPNWADRLSTSVANGVLGPAAAQDLTLGTTRQMTRTRHGLAFVTVGNLSGAYQAQDTIGTATTHEVAVLRAILAAIPAKDRVAVAAAYAKLSGGKTLSATLGERIRNPNLRAPLMALIPPPVSGATLTHDAFLEQLAVGLVYSNQLADEMNADTLDERRHSNPAALLAHFGFKAGPLVMGRWGFQMRVFTPIPGKAKWPQPIVAFRGTEGVQLDVKGDGAAKKAAAANEAGPDVRAARALAIEGSVDTVLGDASPTQVGWLQVQPNLKLIDANLSRLKGTAVSTGHSLGGGIAQLVTALRPAHFASVVTFQAPGIDAAEVQKLRQYNAGAGNGTPITARHYRVDGDIVPTAGEQVLDGQIYYFDRSSRPAGTQAPFQSNVAENVQAGHVTPMLSTYIRGSKPVHPDLQVIASQGLKDEATLQPGKDKRDVQTTFSGSYATAQDPRINTEANRKIATGKLHLMPGEDPFEAVIYANIAYNTLLSHIEAVAADPNVKTYEAFRQRCTALLNSRAPLPLDPDDVSLARILKLDHYEDDYDSRPMPTPYGMPVYQKKATPIVTYLNEGVRIPPRVADQVQVQLRVIWTAWRGQ
ncbi:hypothetical protein [Deinococcus radiotolerans]|nr:hypothetical protein [Deinococcus radiotolerans]